MEIWFHWRNSSTIGMYSLLHGSCTHATHIQMQILYAVYQAFQGNIFQRISDTQKNLREIFCLRILFYSLKCCFNVATNFKEEIFSQCAKLMALMPSTLMKMLCSIYFDAWRSFIYKEIWKQVSYCILVRHLDWLFTTTMTKTHSNAVSLRWAMTI